MAYAAEGLHDVAISVLSSNSNELSLSTERWYLMNWRDISILRWVEGADRCRSSRRPLRGAVVNASSLAKYLT
jgi:hypothetical protein